MKKFLSNILSLVITVGSFLLPLLAMYTISISTLGIENSKSINGYDLIGFSEYNEWYVTLYSIAMIALFIFAGLLAVVAIARICMSTGKKSKKGSNLKTIQNLLAIIVAVLSVVIFVSVILMVSNNFGIDVSLLTAKLSMGIASILMVVVSILGAIGVYVYNKK